MSKRVASILGIALWFCASAQGQLFYEIQEKILPADVGLLDQFGRAVSLDGDTLAIGMRDDDDDGNNAGAVYVYVRSGGVWSLQQKVKPTDPTSDKLFGGAVSVDGDTLAVGAPNEGGGSGAAYLFTRTGSVWSQQDKVVPSDVTPNRFAGISVGLSGDTVALGGSTSSGATSSVAIFVRNLGVWAEEAILRATDERTENGFGVAVSLDGDTALIGASGDGGAGHNSGDTYVFHRTGTVWSPQAKLTPDDHVSDVNYGSAVAIRGDVAVASAPVDGDLGSSAGAVYVWERSGSTWTQTIKLHASDGGIFHRFGSSVATDGTSVVVAADLAPVGPIKPGAAYIFDASGGTWVETHKIFQDDGEVSDQFGTAVTMDGGTIAGGAPEADPQGIASGSVYVFTRTAAQPQQVPMGPTPTPTEVPAAVGDWKLYD